MRRLLALAVFLGALLIPGTLLNAPAAHAATQSPGQLILDRAETRTGDWYVYGADGPAAFDCSGLIYWSATSIGLKNWPRDTYDIAAEIGTRFTITDHPERGDLALWGPVDAPYHVEIVTEWYQTTFGAASPGTRVAWHDDAWFAPDFYLHINWLPGDLTREPPCRSYTKTVSAGLCSGCG